jgi:hypothetical protein
MSDNNANMQKIETCKLAIHELVRLEAEINQMAVPEGELDRVYAALLYNKLIVAFPPRIVVPQLNSLFQTALMQLILTLKQEMYDPEYGVWLSFNLMLGENKTYLFLFNYDEPADVFSDLYDIQAYKDELTQWPRAKENIPAWWNEKITHKE